MKVSQIFGPTIQGEGSATGRHCLFIRMYGCNLTCSFCDTPYTWADTPEKAAKTLSGQEYDRDEPILGRKEMSSDDVLKQLNELWDYKQRPTTVVISGGEPMMQQVDLMPVVRALRLWNNEVHIETAGTISPANSFEHDVNQFNVSPKLYSSGNRGEMRYKPEVLRRFVLSGKAWFKFVICKETILSDFAEVDKIVQDCGIPPATVMVMPEGTNHFRVMATSEAIIEEALRRGYGLSTRLHVLLWGNNPGR